MSACHDIDALMLDRLYDELAESESGLFDQHVAGCARCRTELESLRHTREALQVLPEEEPPSALSAILLHEAAKRAPGERKRAVTEVSDARPGFFAWLAGLLMPVVRHPAAAAVATLVLVAGVATSLYLGGHHKVSEPRVASEAPEPAHAELEGRAGAPAPTALPAAPGRFDDSNVGAGEEGYAARLADEGDLSEIGLAGARAGDGQDKVRATKTAETDPPRWESSGESTVTTVDRGLSTPPASKTRPAQKRPADLDLPVTTNAVSGADELVEADDADGTAFRGQVQLDLAKNNRNKDVAGSGELESERLETQSGAGGKAESGRDRALEQDYKKKAPAKPTRATTAPGDMTGAPQAPPPPAAEPAAGYRVHADPAKELAWARTQEQQMSRAVESKRCRDAARIANDILDRNPEYYFQKVDGSKAVKSCSWYVSDEQKRRAQYRAKAPATKSGSSSAKAKAAKQPNEAADAAE